MALQNRIVKGILPLFKPAGLDSKVFSALVQLDYHDFSIDSVRQLYKDRLYIATINDLDIHASGILNIIFKHTQYLECIRKFGFNRYIIVIEFFENNKKPLLKPENFNITCKSLSNCAKTFIGQKEQSFIKADIDEQFVYLPKTSNLDSTYQFDLLKQKLESKLDRPYVKEPQLVPNYTYKYFDLSSFNLIELFGRQATFEIGCYGQIYPKALLLDLANKMQVKVGLKRLTRIEDSNICLGGNIKIYNLWETQKENHGDQLVKNLIDLKPHQYELYQKHKLDILDRIDRKILIRSERSYMSKMFNRIKFYIKTKIFRISKRLKNFLNVEQKYSDKVH